MIIYFETTPRTSTEIDVVEEGTVPILLSLEQMRNLRIVLEHTPECDFITCESFGMKRTPLLVSTTNHVVLNFLDIVKAPTKTTPCQDGERCFHSVCVSAYADQHEAFPVDDDDGEVNCPACAGQHRKHICGKVKSRDRPKEGPKDKDKPKPKKAVKPKPLIPLDAPLEEPPEKNKASSSKGDEPAEEATEEEIRRSEEFEVRRRMNSKQSEKGPSAQADQPEVNPPVEKEETPEEEPEKVVEKSLDRIHEKLKRPQELLKLHLKRHHMTPTQFRKRTSALKIPEEI